MGIQSFIKKVAEQTIVYWGNPQPGGTGGWTYDKPIERKCRWDDTVTIVRDSNGVEHTCKAELLLTEDVDLNSYVMLGTLDDLKESADPDPLNYNNAFMIGRFDKNPEFKSTTKFVRIAYVGYQTAGK